MKSYPNCKYLIFSLLILLAPCLQAQELKGRLLVDSQNNENLEYLIRDGYLY